MATSVTSSPSLKQQGSARLATKLSDKKRRSRWASMPWLIRGCVLILLGFIVMGALATWIAPHDPVSQTLVARLQPTALHAEGSSEYVLGTDQLGRDVLSRLI